MLVQEQKIVRILREKEKILRYSSERTRGKRFLGGLTILLREEMFKQKRAFTGEGATATAGA